MSAGKNLQLTFRKVKRVKYQMTRNPLIGLILILFICLCVILAAIGALVLPPTRAAIQQFARGTAPTPGIAQTAKATPTRREIITPPPLILGTPKPNILPTFPATPVTAVARDTIEALQRAQLLPRDLFQIAPRLSQNLASLRATPAPRARGIGDQETFHVIVSATSGKYRAATATLQVISPHAYFWVEEGQRFDRDALQRSADFFEQNTYPTNRRYFGSERIPGPDGDTRIHIFNGKLDENTGGYFSSSDTYPPALAPFSNQRHLIYINLPATTPGSSNYHAVLAHEFQHLVHNNQSSQKAAWIDEGMGELAIRLNGFPVGTTSAFAENPDTQLNTWGDDPRENIAHYGAAYLFFNYLAGRFGPDLIRDIVLAPCDGICGVQAALATRASGLAFDEVFADWAVANYLNDPALENGRYAYPNEKDFRISQARGISRYPTQLAATMFQYATNYYALEPAAPAVTIYFTGTTTTRLLSTDARSGRWMWYSNRADLANMHLTRPVDLTRVTRATLRFWTWYHLEKDFDYAYVEVSTDGGKTWDMLAGKTTTSDNPNGSSFGPAFTSKSGGETAQWIQEQMDLTPYAGKQVLLRFEHITDDVYNAPGWVIDDIEIPEIGFTDDAESGAQGWSATGFVRVDNVLPQKYSVQVVQVGNGTRVTRLPLDALNRGNLTITGFDSLARVTVIVTAHAPTTTEPTEYQIGVAPK